LSQNNCTCIISLIKFKEYKRYSNKHQYVTTNIPATPTYN